jgi:hypothetical protein
MDQIASDVTRVGFNELKELDAERLTREAAAVADYQSKPWSFDGAKAFRGDISDVQFLISQKKAEADTAFRLFKDGERPTEPNDAALWDFYKLMDANRKGSTDKLNYDTYESAADAQRASWTPPQRAYVDGKLAEGSAHNPAVQKFYNDRQAIEDAGYWEIDRKQWQAVQADPSWDQYGVDGYASKYEWEAAKKAEWAQKLRDKGTSESRISLMVDDAWDGWSPVKDLATGDKNFTYAWAMKNQDEALLVWRLGYRDWSDTMKTRLTLLEESKGLAPR